MPTVSFPSQQIHHTKAQLYSLYYDCSGCRCYHFGNRSKLSEILEEYSMYGGLGLDKDKVMTITSVKSKIATKKNELNCFPCMQVILFHWRNIKC